MRIQDNMIEATKDFVHATGKPQRLASGWTTETFIDVQGMLGSHAARRALSACVIHRTAGMPPFRAVMTVERDYAMGVIVGNFCNVNNIAVSERGMDTTKGIAVMGELPPDASKVLLLTDVTCSGNTCRRLIEDARKLGYEPVGVLSIVDTSPNNNAATVCESLGVKFSTLMLGAEIGVNPSTPPVGYVSEQPAQAESSAQCGQAQQAAAADAGA